MKKKILLSVLLLNMFQIVEAASYVSCGGSGDIPSAIPAFIRGIILIIKYLVPLGLILFGGYDLLKVVYSNDKKDMDDVVRKLIEKTIAGVAVFFVVAGVQLLVKQTSSSSNISNCVSCFAVSENYCNVYDKEEEDHSDEKRTNDEARKERDEKREQGRKENEKTSDAAKKEAEKEIDPESVRNGSSSPGSSLSSGDASGILEGAKKVHSVYESQKWFYYTDLGQLRWNDVQYSTNNPSKATCCATFVGSAFLVGGVFTEQELNQVNYNSVFGISEICEKHGWSKVTNYSQLQPGDIVIMTSPGSGSSPGHVQIYAGNGTWYNAGSTWAIQSPNPYSSDASGRFLWAWRIPASANSSSNSSSSNSSNSNTNTELTTKIKNYISSSAPSGKWAVYVKNLNTGEVSSYNATNSMTSASVIKLFIAGTTYDKINKGQLSEGSVSSRLQNMIRQSSNEDANQLIDIVGGMSVVNSYASSNGYSQTKLNRYFLRSGPENVISAQDVGNFLEKVNNGQMVNSTYSNKLLNHLKNQGTTHKIPRGVSCSGCVANKTGELPNLGVANDAAIVYSPKGTYVIVVLSEVGASNYSRAESSVTEISRIVYNHYNS